MLTVLENSAMAKGMEKYLLQLQGKKKKVKIIQLCLTLCDPLEYIVLGIL